MVAPNDDNNVNEILTVTASDRHCFYKLLEASAKYLNEYASNDQYLENKSPLPYDKCDHYSRLRLLAWRLLYNESCENMNTCLHPITCKLQKTGIFLFDKVSQKILPIFNDHRSISAIGDSLKGCSEFIMYQLHKQVNNAIKKEYSRLDNIFHKQDYMRSIGADFKRLIYSKQFIDNFTLQLNNNNKNCLNFLTQTTFSGYMMVVNQLTHKLYNVIFSIDDNFILNNYQEENGNVNLEIIGKVSIKSSVNKHCSQDENVFPIKFTHSFKYGSDCINQGEINIDTNLLDKDKTIKELVGYNEDNNKTFLSTVEKYLNNNLVISNDDTKSITA